MGNKKRYLVAVLLLSLLLSWAFTGCSTEDSQIQQTQEPAPILDGPMALGDPVPELTFTTSEGEKISVSQLLQEKKLVVLNFWFANCSWCMKEFPAMEVAYQRYRDDIEIIAVNPVDSADEIAAFQQERGFSFPMAGCSRDLALIFGVGGYPTSVFVDREGIVSMIHTGAITDTETFYEAFEHYTADDYQSETYLHISEIVD